MTYDQIKPYIEKGLVSEQVHPENPDVRIFNYTQTCQFAQTWDDITRQCRGLILNVKTGEILARPFPKFFNYGEHVTKGWAIPTTKPEIYEKLDGSLGIYYQLNDKPWIATRGSFTSDQAKWATEWWRANVSEKADQMPGITHLFEIIYPQNRIVVSYDYSGLVHLVSLDNESHNPLPVSWDEPMRHARKIESESVTELLALDEPNSEGFVVFYPEENVRMKIKFPEYVRLHRIVTGVSEIAIWEMLRDGKPLAYILENVPDEFYKWVEATKNKLVSEFQKIQNTAQEDYVLTLDSIQPPGTKEEYPEYRKAFAINAQTRKYPSLLFALLDKKPTHPLIWRMVRPHGARPFKTDIDL